MRLGTRTAGAVGAIWLVGGALFATANGCTCDELYEEDADLDAEPDAPGDGDADGDTDADTDAAVDASGDAEPDSEVSSDPYGPCPCPDGEECITTMGCPTCGIDCVSMMDCPEPATGTAYPDCMPVAPGELRCILVCASGQTCPDGMVCDEEFEVTPACQDDCVPDA